MIMRTRLCAFAACARPYKPVLRPCKAPFEGNFQGRGRPFQCGQQRRAPGEATALPRGRGEVPAARQPVQPDTKASARQARRRQTALREAGSVEHTAGRGEGPHGPGAGARSAGIHEGQPRLAGCGRARGPRLSGRHLSMAVDEIPRAQRQSTYKTFLRFSTARLDKFVADNAAACPCTCRWTL